MTALNFQKAFAQLLTDSDARSDLAGQKTENFGKMGLDESQINNLLLFDADSVSRYSRMLSATRLSMVLNVLPFTKKLLSEDLINSFVEDYEMKEPPTTSPGSPTIEEVKRFDRYLMNSPEILKSAKPFLSDVSRYETTLFFMRNEFLSADSGGGVEEEKPKIVFRNEPEFSASRLKLGEKIKIRRFQYDVIKIISSLQRGEIPDSDKKNVNLILQALPQDIKVKSVGDAVYALIELCDGSSSVEEICNRFVKHLSQEHPAAEEAGRAIIKTLKDLTELRILVSVW